MSIRMERTGDAAVDVILDEIENASHIYHNTEQWSEAEDAESYSPLARINAAIRYAGLHLKKVNRDES